MAEMIAVTLLAKFAAALSSPAAVGLSSLAGVRSGMEAAAKDLELLLAFLRSVDSLRGSDALADAWVGQVRDVAFDLEDAADEYAFLSRHSFFRHGGNLGAWFALSRRLWRARERLRELSAAKEQLGIRPAEVSAPSSAAGGRSASTVGRTLAEASHFVEEDEIVGFEMHKRLLMKWLTGDADPRRMLIAVCGMGGVGKTTLVTNVYKKVTASGHFDCAAWVAVSKSFTTEDLLRRIAKEFHRDARAGVPWDVDNMDYRSLVEALRGHLSKKRYVLLLDDVWDAHAWYEIRQAFVDDGTESRIIITTRSQDIASLASSNRIVRLEPLSELESWSLFCNTAFRDDADRECPYRLRHWASKIVEGCCGLPLAIVSVANLLVLKDRTEFAWKNVYDNLAWYESSDYGIGQVSSILNLSFDDMPYHLKKLFLYCSIYPEDFMIKRKTLIRTWVAEGLIEEKGNSTMEEVADDYLNQLVQRSLLQVPVQNEFGRAKRCCIHDLIREMIVHRSAKERFFVFSKCTATLGSSKKARHLVFDRCRSDRVSAPKMNSLRSFHVFKADLDASLFSSFRLLTVLNLWFIPIVKLPIVVTDLLNLRYLGIRSTLIDELPEELGQLHNLQTLDAKWSMVQRLPRSIIKLKNLRHLVLYRRRSADFTYPGPGMAIALPDGVKNLTCLQTLKYIEADEKMIRSLGSLKQMRSLELCGVHESNLIHLPSSISKMSCLLRLGIISQDAKVKLDLEPFYPPPIKLQKLTLEGILVRGKLPSWFGSLNNLMQLRLHSSNLMEDSVVLLSSLPRLLHLSLVNAYSGKSLTFANGYFPALKKLSLQDLPNLSHLEFQKGSLVDLHVLMLGRCDQLTKIPQDIRNLVHLETLDLFEMPSEMIHHIRNDEVLQEHNHNSEHTIKIKSIRWHYGKLLEEKIYINLSLLESWPFIDRGSIM
ncbi:disease resistance protein RPM1-like [Oryza brachyantha]|uniref:AAA+ ATPase domain-containing protein n=1 Tax=Oryza brachyantha TaxID=4533 RepID=J3M048_ORYBR|nr:disease resistance protein RPM1-like [Oryza brachyantha]XP_040378861.1 disease resistance protein RPM1-like [Oryza brachyantha]